MIAEIIGRFHPLIVHLPVGILILAFLMELASRTKKYAKVKVAMPFVLQVGAITALVALLTGWVMPKEGDFDENLLGLHFWFSVSLTITTVLLSYLCYGQNAISRKLYLPVFSLAMILLTVTGHFGGSLTHGEGHLTKEIKKESKIVVTDVNTLSVFPDLITPILKKKCYSCHNDGKKKGELVMTNSADLMKGGAEGPVIVKGNVEKSSLVQRVHLPEEDEAHMPPKGKVQLTENEISIIEWWIAAGADFESKVGDIEQSEDIATILKTYESQTTSLDPSKLDLIAPSTIFDLAAVGITLIPQAENNPFAYASFQRDTSITSAKIKKLKGIAKHITELDLSFTNLDDQMMSQLSRFTNLQKLKIQHTRISSSGLKHLEKLTHLNSLNLYGTNVDNTGLTSVRKLASLTSLYLWNTKVTKEGVDGFKAEKPLVEISHQIDDSVFGESRLMPPLITADQDIFEDSLKVTMSLNFRNVDVFYTVDGTDPDSTSMKYDSSFYVTETASVKAITAKPGWTTSEPSSKTFIKVGHTIASVTVDKAPDKRYKAKGPKSLIDLKKGSMYSDGLWLGYEGSHMTATLDLGSKKACTNVVVGALEETVNYIFFPVAIKVKISTDGKSFTSVADLTIPQTKIENPSTVKQFLLQFEEKSARYIQVQITSSLTNPEWHAAPGAKNWLFIDEIMVN